ncbi:MAG: diaminopimelate decarboxylase [Deltaproteobacteria bacterium]|nr:diaminopimelate decarboxylase [Deltaproteobacteria bacterium]
MNHFEYQGDRLFCEGVALDDIAAKVGTPTYVYSHATLERHFRVFDEAFTGIPHIVCFSVKANSNIAVLRAMVKWGAGMDIVSGGELYRALRAGADPQKIVFSCVGKREDEIEAGLRAGILCFNVESPGEIELIEKVAARMNTRAAISIRVNPDVDAETHPYISTGLKKNKFGLPMDAARAEYRKAMGMPHIVIRGIDCHIGSQLTKTMPFHDAIARVAGLARELKEEGVPLTHLDIGGGLGIPYKEEEPPSPAEYGRAVIEALAPFRGMDLTVICEPGRVIVGNAGILLTRTLYLKQGEAKNFVIVDAAFNDLLRPAFYDSYHGIKPVLRRAGAATLTADVVGPICESGDFLARDRELRRPEPGDLMAFMSAGAYGFSMSSNYNTRPRAAEVLVHGDQFSVVRERETVEELLENEHIPDWLK